MSSSELETEFIEARSTFTPAASGAVAGDDTVYKVKVGPIVL